MRTIPNTYERPGSRSVLPGGDIRDVELKLLTRDHNYLYAHQIARLDGFVFRPAWTSESDTSFTTTPNNVQMMPFLDEWTGFGRLTRVTETDHVYLTVASLMEEMDLEWTIRIPFHHETQTSGSTVTTVTQSNTTTTRTWFLDVVELDLSTVSAPSSAINEFAPVAVDIAGKANDLSAQALEQVALFETVLTQELKLPRQTTATL